MRTFDSTLSLFLISLVTLAVVHIVALALSLYWIYPWFDMPMHFLGGVSIGLGAQTALFTRTFHFRPRRMTEALALAFCVGVLWELFEWHAGIGIVVAHYSTFMPNYRMLYMFDTIKDLSLDIIGGTVGFRMAQALNTHLH